jgi:hypothetical protein
VAARSAYLGLFICRFCPRAGGRLESQPTLMHLQRAVPPFTDYPACRLCVRHKSWQQRLFPAATHTPSARPGRVREGYTHAAAPFLYLAPTSILTYTRRGKLEPFVQYDVCCAGRRFLIIRRKPLLYLLFN